MNWFWLLAIECFLVGVGLHLVAAFGRCRLCARLLGLVRRFDAWAERSCDAWLADRCDGESGDWFLRWLLEALGGAGGDLVSRWPVDSMDDDDRRGFREEASAAVRGLAPQVLSFGGSLSCSVGDDGRVVFTVLAPQWCLSSGFERFRQRDVCYSTLGGVARDLQELLEEGCW